MEALVDELAPEFGEGKIFRPYRDIRFSADKSPYKTNIAATLGAGYVQLSADGLGAGSGMWHMAPDQLDRYREAVDEDRSGRGARGRRGRGEEGRLTVIGHEQLKTAPKGYAEGPSPHRAAALQGPDHVEGVGRRRPGSARRRPRTGSWSSSGDRNRSTRGSRPTSVRRRCPSGGGDPPQTRGRSTSVNSV